MCNWQKTLCLKLIATYHLLNPDDPLYSDPIFSFWPHFSGGKGLYAQLGFSSSFVDQYIHRTEFWVVQLENLRSVEYQFNTIFLILRFPMSYRRLKFLRSSASLPLFRSKLDQFCYNYEQIVGLALMVLRLKVKKLVADLFWNVCFR